MEKYILAIDQGTTSTRAIIFDKEGKLRSSAMRELENLFPHEGWVEIDPLKIWIGTVDVVNEVLIRADLTMNDIDSIGVTNQRETAIVWDKKTGKPVYNAVVWQSRQSEKICDEFEKRQEKIEYLTSSRFLFLPIN